MPHEIARSARVRSVLADVSTGASPYGGFSVSRVAPFGDPVCCSSRSRSGRSRRTSAALPGFGTHVAVGRAPRSCSRSACRGRWRADSSAPSARAGRNRGRATHRPRRAWPPCGRAPTASLEVEDQPSGREREPLRAASGRCARPRVERRRGRATLRRPSCAFIAFRRATMTTSPCWLSRGARNVTMPH